MNLSGCRFRFYCLCFVLCLTFTHRVIAYEIEAIKSSPKSDLADGSHWDVDTQSLFYADLSSDKPTLNRYDYRGNCVYSAKIQNRTFTSFIIPLDGRKNQFAVGVERNIEIIDWDGVSDVATINRTVINVESEDFYSTNSFNDGKADPNGRLWAGTERLLFCKDNETHANASLYSYSKYEGLRRYRTDVYSSNGLIWNEKKQLFYYIDSCKFDIKEYDWDPTTGEIHNPRIAYDFRVNGEFPGFIADGMTIDRDGLLWVALFKGDRIVVVDPKIQKIVQNITIPAHQVTSAAFGGPNLDELFVTTAAKPFNLQIGTPDPEAVEATHSPLSGHLFKLTGLNSRGYPSAKLTCI